jgi:hypothetical protein
MIDRIERRAPSGIAHHPAVVIGEIMTDLSTLPLDAHNAPAVALHDPSV